MNKDINVSFRLGNTPANNLYLKLDTEQKLDWIYYRLSQNDLDRLKEEQQK